MTGQPSEPLSIRAYAKRRGCSHQAVMKAIAAGRLQDSLVWVDGVARIADPELADREWAANTDLSRAHDDVKARAAGEISAHLEPQAHGGALKRSTAAPPDDPLLALERELAGLDVDGPPVEAPPDTLAAASAREKYFRAKLAELKYLTTAGELVNAQELREAIVEQIATSRTKLLGLPSKCKQRLPHLSLDDLATIEGLVHESLEELAAPPAAVGAGA